MLSKQRITGINAGRLRTDPRDVHTTLGFVGRPSAPTVKKPVNASISFNGGSGNTNISVSTFWASAYQYMMTGIIAADPTLIDSNSLALFYRR